MSSSRAIAIVGLGCILPDALNVESFWNNILNKRYSITEVPPERWNPSDYYHPDPTMPDKTYSKIGGWVRGFAFDWKRYKLPPKVVASMDPGQQWAVSIAAQALADYGYPERPLDTDRTGVILGTAMGGELHYLTTLRIMFPEFANALKGVHEFGQLPAAVRQTILAKFHQTISDAIVPITEDSMPGELANIVSGRVANLLNLRGPSFITDAACASALAALDAACELLVNHEADAVLTGGVDRNMGVSSFVKFCKIGALSATGTRPFGDGADGFVMGEGSAAFLLKRLEDAEQNGDKIYAVIRGIGGSSDGKGKGITAPNPVGQQLAIRRAWEAAELNPASATLVEAHGTSTKVGDVVEVESLAAIFSGGARHSIALGSVKSNFGHLKAGAGAAGLLKATLALHHKILPPTLNARTPNPNIDFSRTPFYLNHEPQAWKANGDPRRAAVSAYGFGGTNFHVVLEAHQPGVLTQKSKVFAMPDKMTRGQDDPMTGTVSPVTPSSGHLVTPSAPPPFRGILALGSPTANELKDKLDRVFRRVQAGWTPPVSAPESAELRAPERIVIDYAVEDGRTHTELQEKLGKAQKALGFDTAPAWRPLAAQGIFRGRGNAPGKIAFLFPGQGSQYLNMGKELAQHSPTVAQVFKDADAVMTPILGRSLTSYIFVESTDPAALKQGEKDLTQTAITQPAMLTLDTALYKLLGDYGFAPDLVMGHSLGEYAALVAAGVMPFAHALEASAARGAEMTKVSMGDNGWMAAVMAPLEVVEKTLQSIEGYVVAANVNSRSQAVIGGESQAVEQAIGLFIQKGYQAMRIPVSHAFHTRIVAPASKPLRQVLNRLTITPPRLPLVANVTGELYPTDVEAIKDLLEQQIAAPVQWVQGLETLYAQGVRTFIEVGPKRALKGFVDDVLGDKAQVISLFTNHPKTGELVTFNQALCGLYAAGYGGKSELLVNSQQSTVNSEQLSVNSERMVAPPFVAQAALPKEVSMPSSNNAQLEALGQLLAQALHQAQPSLITDHRSLTTAFDRNAVPAGSVIISGTGLGLPGADKPVMAEDNAQRILRGEQFVDLIPERFRKQILGKRITRLVKSDDGSGRFETLTDPDEVIKLAGRPGAFDLAEEYGVPEKLVEALDTTTQLAMAAGLDALREAGIPLVQTWKKTTTGKFLPDRWQLPTALRDETGVIFASAFPGGDRFADEFTRYYTHQNRQSQLATLEDLRRYTQDPDTLRELQRRIADLREQLEREPYEFDRRFLFRILAMGHSQFAEYIGARGPNTQVNSACASTAQAIAIAEDWIRSGRCRRVIVIGADNVTGEHLMEWVGAGFLATGAAATDDRVEEAALPFDRRRHGTLLGMGACALVLESEDAVRERGMRGLVELLASETNNSAFHGTRLDVNHIAQVMNHLITAAERRFGLHRHAIAPQTVFMSHETFTPARGGSAAAEVTALRHTFGDSASDIIMANTKGFTGHPMGVGIEDVIAVKILEYGIVPPVPNFKEVDPDLGRLNLSRGGRYPVQYAIHLAAGFGSQISLTLTRRIPGALDRVDNPPQYQRWLADVSGYDRAEAEVVQRVLRIKSEAAPTRSPMGSAWQLGLGPTVRAAAPGTTAVYADIPARMAMPVVATSTTPVPVSAPAPKLAPAPEPVKVVSAPPPVVPIAVVAPAPQLPITNNQSTDPVVESVLALVAEKTGYPRDMLDLDLDMEADLGIDTVKQAETFAAIREQFNIPRRDDMRLRDYNTLAKVVGFVREGRPDLAVKASGGAEGQRSKGAGEQGSVADVSPLPPLTPAPLPATDPVVESVLALVAEKTGYPRDMLDLDLDMEADLGIDTVKQAETFAAIREQFNIPRRDDMRLRDYNTLAKVVGFVREGRPDLAEGSGASLMQKAESSQATTPVPIVNQQSAIHNQQSADSVVESVLTLVAEKTGYPRDMLDLDLDMEADLGIDTVKQAETFAAIREQFNIPRRDDVKLRDYNTLAKVVGFVYESRPELADKMTGGQDDKMMAGVQPVILSSGHPVTASPYTLEAADRFPRRVPTPTLRPALELCKPTGVTLDEQSRVVVMLDKGGVGKALVNRLQKRGVSVLPLEDAPAEVLEKQVKAWLADGLITGVYWLPALDVEPALEDLDLATFRDLNRVRVKNLYSVMRVLYDAVSAPGTFLVSATRLGGLHGYGVEGATAPLGGAVTGFTKAYKRERPQVTVKAVDFDISRKTAEPADVLIAETLSDPGVVEVGYFEGQRYSVTLIEQPAQDGQPGLPLNADTVFVITGAAGGITSAITADLAANSGGKFYLLDLVPLPAANHPHIVLFRNDKEALKQRLIEDAKAAGERPTPVMIDKKVMALEREEAALRAKEAVEAAGGTAHYFACDLRDGAALAKVVDDIRARYGRIDVLVHAGGLEISRALPDKDLAQFDLVFDVKADGFFSLLKAAHGLPIGATVAFSSVAGRFGNSGQTDYSAANDLLCKITSSLRHWRPATRGLVIDWTAWGGIGMATRGSIPKIMEMAGIEMLAPESGIPTVRRELVAGGFKGEIVVGGKMGMMMAEFDATGGLDPAKATQAAAARKLLLVGEVKAAKLYGGLAAETSLDPTAQPFLYDHAMEGTPLLPGVMGTEAFAQLASLLVPGYTVAAIENEQFESPFKFYRNQPRTLHLSATLTPAANGELLAHTTLRSITHLPSPTGRGAGGEGTQPQEKIHFRATVRLTSAPLLPCPLAPLPSTATTPPISRTALYNVYFHGPAYQVLDRAQVDGNTVIGWLAPNLPPNSHPADAASFMAPRLIELCFQTAGVWEMKTKGVMALPLGLGSVTTYAQPETANGHPLCARVETLNNGTSFNAQVVDASGKVYVALHGYRTVALEEKVNL